MENIRKTIKPVTQAPAESLPSQILVNEEPKAVFVNQPINQHLR